MLFYLLKVLVYPWIFVCWFLMHHNTVFENVVLLWYIAFLDPLQLFLFLSSTLLLCFKELVIMFWVDCFICCIFNSFFVYLFISSSFICCGYIALCILYLFFLSYIIFSKFLEFSIFNLKNNLFVQNTCYKEIMQIQFFAERKCWFTLTVVIFVISI